jgi:hypothetical protein
VLQRPKPPETLGGLAGRLRYQFYHQPAVGVALKPAVDTLEGNSVWIRYPPGAKPAELVPCGMERAAWWSG